MNQISWIRLARSESHWGLYHALHPPTPLPPIEYWLRQPSADTKTKTFLKKLCRDSRLTQLIEAVGVSVEEVATIVVFFNIENGWFDKTITSFKKVPPPFSFAKDVKKLKVKHTVWNLIDLFCTKAPRMPVNQAAMLTERIMRLMGRRNIKEFLNRMPVSRTSLRNPH